MKQRIFNRLTLVIAVLALIVATLAVSYVGPEALAQSVTRIPGTLIVRGLGIFEDDVTVTGDLTVAGTFSPAGSFDLNGAALTLDADADSTLTADTDDQVDLALSGVDVLSITTTTLNLDDHIIVQDINTENVMHPTVLAVPITYTAAAGGSGVVATIGAGEIWFVHSVFIQVTDDFDTTGDDATLVIGDGNVAAGFINAADANLQASFTEATGFAAGWFGIESGSAGAYTTDDGGPFVYAPGSAETIDYLIDETSGETLTAGAATIYVIYTRIQ